MKVAICYPSFETSKGIPQISQNRQFQWTTSGPVAYFIYPVVPASAATLLKTKGYDVYWLDGLAQKQSYEEWSSKLGEINPELIAIETKTPVIKKHWQIIDNIKDIYPGIKIVLMGDHVTALPLESMKNSRVDFVITGGDYDFLLLNIANFLSQKQKLEPGIWYRNQKKIINTGKFKLDHNLDSLPIIDRDLTKWYLYAYKNSNFFRTPGAYTMFGRDCWWGKCTFCSWTTLFPGNCYRTISVKKALDEVGNLITKYQIKEIMDDSGAFPTGDWLRNFCQGMIKRGYHKKVYFNCNMRFNAGLSEKDYQLMGKAGFRFILYGLESASQKTLDKINKNLKVENIQPVLEWAKLGGLMPHLTVMVGYPWENKVDLDRTISLAEKFFTKGLADSMQATIIIPYPGTPLFDYCKKNKLLTTTNWDHYDMRQPVMKTNIPEIELLGAVRELYSKSILNPKFILKTILMLKNWDGVKYVAFQGFKFFGKLWEFR